MAKRSHSSVTIRWTAKSPPTTSKEISRIESDLGITLPSEYREFLLRDNGGEGWLGDNFIAMWSAENIVKDNIDYKSKEFVPGIVLIGSSGGGLAYGIDFSQKPPCYIEVPFMPLDRDLVEKISISFADFFDQVARGRP